MISKLRNCRFTAFDQVVVLESSQARLGESVISPGFVAVTTGRISQAQVRAESILRGPDQSIRLRISFKFLHRPRQVVECFVGTTFLQRNRRLTLIDRVRDDLRDGVFVCLVEHSLCGPWIAFSPNQSLHIVNQDGR